MLRIGFPISIILTLLFSFGAPRTGDRLDRVWHLYSKWASKHPEYECRVSPEMQVVHSRYRLWQIQQESGRVDSILKMTGDSPISHESYVFLDDYGRKVIYFPELNRTVLFCLDKNLGSELEGNSLVISALLSNLKLVKRFLVFEELSETDEGIVFDMIVDTKKMKVAGLVPERVEASKVRLIFSFKKSGELVRLSRQFDEGDLEVLYFDYVSFSPDEVRKSFPKIENRNCFSIIPDFTYSDALKEIKRVRQNVDDLEDK